MYAFFCRDTLESSLHVFHDCTLAKSIWWVVIQYGKLSTIVDVNYAFRGDFLSCCVRITREYVAEFNEPHATVSRTSEVTSR
ncbi:hypothetical protein GQ457_01G055600 [Hibiscus cannabinus]